MNRFYRIAVTKVPVGSAIEHREPPLQGEVVIKVSDLATEGDSRLVVVDATNNQHKINTATPGVEEISEADAVKLAAKYQPKRTMTRFNPQTRKEEKITLSAVDLKKFLGEKQ